MSRAGDVCQSQTSTYHEVIVSDLSYYQDVAMGELVLEVQRCIRLGWEFTFDPGERKFGNARLTARKGDKEVFASAGDIFWQIYRVEFPGQY